MAGCLIAALTFFPLFGAHQGRQSGHLAAQAEEPGDRPRPTRRSARSRATRSAREIDFKTPCDIAKRFLAQRSVSYDNVEGPAGTRPPSRWATRSVTPPAATVVNQKFDADSVAKDRRLQEGDQRRPDGRGLPGQGQAGDHERPWWAVVGILWILVIYVTMVYGPIAAALVELFPTRIRYTSMSLPYHIGNGWFGGLLPTTAFAIVASTGNMYNGLWYPIVVATMTFIIGTLFIRETKDVDIYAGDR